MGALTLKERKNLPPLNSVVNVGLHGTRAFLLLFIWYFFSFTTLVTNKYFLSWLHGDPVILAASQMSACFLLGGLELKYFQGRFIIARQLFKNVAILGTLRFATVFLGLITLWYVPVSFAETVKSCAPVFTVFISAFILSEQTPCVVALSLIPCMLGLALCSSTELNFNVPGFIAAMSTNIVECFQNVHSKRLLSDERKGLTANELQTTSSFFSVVLSVPAYFLLSSPQPLHFDDTVQPLSHPYWVYPLILLSAAVSFHLQSYVEYCLLTRLSSVTHSVANTVKRALMIWLSVLVFGNQVSVLSGVGTGIVFLGVFLYNHTRNRYSMLTLDKFNKVKFNPVLVPQHQV